MRNRKLSFAIHGAFIRVLVSGTESGRSYTGPELAERFEVATTTSWKWLKDLHALDLVYVKEWRRTGRSWTACYSWGFKEDDTERPEPLTQAEHERNYRQRKRKVGASAIERMTL